MYYDTFTFIVYYLSLSAPAKLVLNINNIPIYIYSKYLPAAYICLLQYTPVAPLSTGCAKKCVRASTEKEKKKNRIDDTHLQLRIRGKWALGRHYLICGHVGVSGALQQQKLQQ